MPTPRLAALSSAAHPSRLRARPRSRLTEPPLVVGGIVLVSAAVLAAFSLRVTSFEPDEVGYTHLAIGIARSLTPFTLSYGGADRLNQLYPLLIAPLWGLFGNVTAFRLTHAWNALLMASAAIPSYLLARDVVGRRWAAYLAAGLVSVLPWLALATSELTEVGAYPACAWALLGMHRSLAAPSPKRDALALGAIALATYGRLQLVILAPALSIAMVVHELGYLPRARSSGRGAAALLVRRLFRQHAVLSAATLLGLLVGVPLLLSGELSSAAGFYGNTISGAALGAPTFDLARTFLTGISLGLGGVPAALAVGFVVSSLAAPVARHVHAFATLTLVTVVLLTVQVAEVSVRFDAGVMQERYLFYIAPLLVVGMFAALLAVPRPALAVLCGSAIVGLLVASTNYETLRSAFWYQVSPGLTSFYDWVAPAFGAPAGATAVSDVRALLPAGLVVAALGLLLGLLLLRGVRAARLAVAVAAAAIAFCAAVTVHALVVVVSGSPSAGAGLGGGSLGDVDWVDRSVRGGTATQLIDEIDGIAASSDLWNRNAFWNRSVTGGYLVQFVPLHIYLPFGGLHVDYGSGALRPLGGGAPPRYLVLATRGFPVMPAGRVAARSPGRALELIRLAKPMRAAYALWNISPGGWLPIERPAVLRLYALAAGGGCSAVTLHVWLSPVATWNEELTLDGGGAKRAVSLVGGSTTTVSQTVCAGDGAIPQLRLSVSQPSAAAGREVPPQLQSVAVGTS